VGGCTARELSVLTRGPGCCWLLQARCCYSLSLLLPSSCCFLHRWLSMNCGEWLPQPRKLGATRTPGRCPGCKLRADQGMATDFGKWIWRHGVCCDRTQSTWRTCSGSLKPRRCPCKSNDDVQHGGYGVQTYHVTYHRGPQDYLLSFDIVVRSSLSRRAVLKPCLAKIVVLCV
jgi:hypothetical protein